MSHRGVLTHEAHSFIRLATKAEQKTNVKGKNKSRHQFQATEEEEENGRLICKGLKQCVRKPEGLKASMKVWWWFVILKFACKLNVPLS